MKVLSQIMFPRAGIFAAKTLRNKLNDFRGCKDLVGQVFMDNFIFIPFLFFPTYYFTKEIIMPSSNPPVWETTGISGTLRLIWNRYSSNFIDDVTMTTKIWIIADIINFGIIPPHFRVSFMAMISFGYTVVLSWMRGANKEENVSFADKTN